MKISEMQYIVHQHDIEVTLPIVSQGKFRCKTRDNAQDFGNGFAPTTTAIEKNAYLEWQIGYDTIIGKDEKNTQLKLDSFKFIGANKKMKHPYELSELLFHMCKQKIVSEDELNALYEKIDSIQEFLQEIYKIDVKKENPVTLNKVTFLSSSTKLPTFLKEFKQNNIKIEIMIQKQQYATGIQPMLYLIIPMTDFNNASELIGKTSTITPYGKLIMDSSFKDIIFDTFLCFGMCSKSHNHDIKEILKVIIQNAFN